MSCFPCFQRKEDDDELSKEQIDQLPVAQTRELVLPSPNNNEAGAPSTPPKEAATPAASADRESGNSNAKTFNFRELASATKNFRQECLIGEGGFGKVFKGTLSDGQVVSVKRLDRTGGDNKEFCVEVLVLTLLHHPNLLNLIGYCADGEQRLLVHEYMPMGCLEDHLLDISEDKKPLDWVTRMRIASGVAQGLEYLHDKANPPIIYRDLKSTNILLDEDFNPKLSDYGLAKLEGGDTVLTPRVAGTGYSAPEYERSRELTPKSDVYSFGVVLLELLSGRRAMDPSRPIDQQNLVEWAQPIFRDPKRFPELADPLLGNSFSMTSLNQVVGIAAMCLQQEASVRPLFRDVVAALSFLAMAPPDEPVPAALPPENTRDVSNNKHDSDSSDDDDEWGDRGNGNGTENRGLSMKSEIDFKSKSKSRSSTNISYSSSSSSSSDDENDHDDDDDDDNSRNMSFCYSVNAYMNMRQDSVGESNEASVMSKNQSFGSLSTSSDDDDDEDDDDDDSDEESDEERSKQ